MANSHEIREDLVSVLKPEIDILLEEGLDAEEILEELEDSIIELDDLSDEEVEELTELQKRLLMDVEDEEEVLPPEARGFEPPKEEKLTKADIRLYTHPHFDWNAKHTWQNDPKAVQYWLRYIKPKKEDDEFTKKTY